MKKTGKLHLNISLPMLLCLVLVFSAFSSLAIAQEEDSISALTKKLGSPDSLVRAKSAYLLGQRHSEAEPAIAALIRLLGDDAPVDPRKIGTWRWRGQWKNNGGPRPTSPGFEAANALGNIGKAAVTPLIKELSSSSWFVRMNASEALGDIEDKRSLKPLMTALKSEKNIEVKVALLDALGELEDPKALSLIGSFTRDKVVKVRLAALWALEELELPEAGKYFVAAMKDREARVREAAIWGLEEFEDSKYVPIFLTAIKDPDKEVKKAALEALSDIEDPATADVFIKLLKEKDIELVRLGVHALGDMEVKSAVPGLIKLLHNSDLKIRKAAICALGDIGDRSAAVHLSRIIETEKDPELKRMAVDAISDLY